MLHYQSALSVEDVLCFCYSYECIIIILYCAQSLCLAFSHADISKLLVYVGHVASSVLCCY